MTREQIRLAVKETAERLAKDLPSSPNRLRGKDLHRELLRLSLLTRRKGKFKREHVFF